MRELAMNVWVDGKGYGPSFPDKTPPDGADLPDHVWADAALTADSLAGLEIDVGETARIQDSLDDVPLHMWDKPRLLALADARGIKVNKRHGVRKLAETIAKGG